jgi:hypothetical protein
MKKYVEYIKEFNKPWVKSLPDGTSKVKLFYFMEGIAKLVGEELASGMIQMRKLSGQFGSHSIESLGSGFFGTAFELKSGKVLKFTGDPSEALYAHMIMNSDKEYENLVKYHKVVKVGGNNVSRSDNSLYVLVMDKVDKFKFNEYQVDALEDMAYDFVGVSLEDFIEEQYNGSAYDNANLFDMITEPIWEDIQGIYQDCYDLGLGHPDSHAGNVGQIDGHLIFYDVSDNSFAVDDTIPEIDVSKLVAKYGI